MTPEWIRKLMEAARVIVPRDFVGQVEINVFKGGVSNINLKQSFKEDSASEHNSGIAANRTTKSAERTP